MPGSDSAVPTIVMEWLDGPTLEERLRGPLFAVHDAQRICHEILNGLEYMHSEGIAHRDLHAGNIMLTVDGVKTIDIDCSQEYSLARLSIGSQEDAMVGDIGFARHVVWSVISHTNIEMGEIAKAEKGFRKATTIEELRNLIDQFEDVVEAAAQPLWHRHQRSFDSLNNSPRLGRRFHCTEHCMMNANACAKCWSGHSSHRMRNIPTTHMWHA